MMSLETSQVKIAHKIRPPGDADLFGLHWAAPGVPVHSPEKYYSVNFRPHLSLKVPIPLL